MEELGLQALHRRVAGIDVHRMLHVVTVLIEQRKKGTQPFILFLTDGLGPPLRPVAQLATGGLA